MIRADKYTEKLKMERFKVIREISVYNHNYHNGFGKDLLFGKSDDDNTTEWWLILYEKSFYLGESYSSEGEVLHRFKERQT